MTNDRENFLVDKENQYKREKFQRMANTRSFPIPVNLSIRKKKSGRSWMSCLPRLHT